MSIERELLISLLKLTRDGSVSHEIINKDAKIASGIAGKLLEKLQNDGLVNVKKGIVEADGLQRLKMAVKSVSLGADLERVSSFLKWQEFENITAFALARNNYKIHKNLRFKHANRRWEIDIVGCKKPLALCIDCKHWHHGIQPSTLKRIVEKQVERTSALAASLPMPSPKIECASWKTVKLIPAVLSLVAGRFKFYDNVPIVPVLQLQDFLGQLPAYVDSLKHFTKQLSNQLNGRA
jgi:hypothetical protein